MSEAQRVVLGRVSGAHGLRGQLRVRRLGGDAENLVRQPALWLADDESGSQPRRYELVDAAPGRPGELRVTLAGVGDRDAAEALRGKWVLAPADALAPLPEGEYYGFQLVGCRVESADGELLGRVRAVWSTGAPDVLVVEDAAGRELLIPAAAELLREVDLEAGRIVVEVLPGLLDPV